MSCFQQTFTLLLCDRAAVSWFKRSLQDAVDTRVGPKASQIAWEKNLIWPKISKKKKWKKKCFLACQLMTTQRAPVGLHHYVFPLSASTLKWVGDLPTHNAFAKALWESEFGHNFPNKYRQFQTFQPSQLAFVWAIWHSHNAHVFQMPPSCLFLQFWVFFTF